MTIEQAKQENQTAIDLSMALYRLEQNTDFRKVFLEFYGQDYILDLHQNLALHNNMSDEHTAIINKLMAVSFFKQFMQTIKENGAMALTANKELDAILLENDNE